MPLNPEKLHELAMKYDPLPVLAAIEAATKHAPPATQVNPAALQSLQQGLMTPPATAQPAAPAIPSPWGQ